MKTATNNFDEAVMAATGAELRAERIRIIQVNIGLKCNLQCRHCHVASAPTRKEEMDWDTMTHILRVARDTKAELVDITGGAPEMNPHFKRFVAAVGELGIPVQVRTNLTILLEPGYEDVAQFMADQRVRLVASLPCYLKENVDKQRGLGVYEDSVKVIQQLNELGYGREPELPLDLVYNPGGPSLPPDQSTLERDYKRILADEFGIEFNSLNAITNMPIGRFMGDLRRLKKADHYRQLLRDAFNPGTIDPLMCRHQIDVDWNGTMYDCDFNLALKMPVNHGMPTNIRDFDPALHTRRIETGNHCFGCTAGCGSSCGGALV